MIKDLDKCGDDYVYSSSWGFLINLSQGNFYYSTGETVYTSGAIHGEWLNSSEAWPFWMLIIQETDRTFRKARGL